MGSCHPQTHTESFNEPPQKREFGSFRPKNKGMKEVVCDPKNGKANNFDQGHVVNSVQEAIAACIYEGVFHIGKEYGNEINLSQSQIIEQL